MLFKVKKYFLPTYLACGAQLNYEEMTKEVFGLYLTFIKDEIWGIRKVAIERAPDILKMLKEDDIERIETVVNMLKKSLNDPSRWVKFATFGIFGEAMHEVSLKK